MGQSARGWHVTRRNLAGCATLAYHNAVSTVPNMSVLTPPSDGPVSPFPPRTVSTFLSPARVPSLSVVTSRRPRRSLQIAHFRGPTCVCHRRQCPVSPLVLQAFTVGRCITAPNQDVYGWPLVFPAVRVVTEQDHLLSTVDNDRRNCGRTGVGFRRERFWQERERLRTPGAVNTVSPGG